MKQKLDSKFETSSDEVKTVWEGILEQAKEMRMGEDGAEGSAAAPAAPAPAGK